MFRQILTAFLTFFIFAGTLTNIAFATNQFQTSYNVNYVLDKDGVMSVSQEINIENIYNDVIVKDYALTINQMEIYDIGVFEDEDELEFSVDSSDRVTTIKTNLKNYVIGEGRKNNLTIRYKTKNIAHKVGEIWNINIPKVSGLENTQMYNVSLSVPSSIGPKIFLSPQPSTESINGENTIYTFNKEILNNKGIASSFGKYQVLNFKLKYHLKNSSYFYSSQEISLPSDVENSQQVAYKNLDPSPEKIYTDGDGNNIAVYRVAPKSELRINLVGTARVFGRQIDPEYGGKFQEIPSKLKTYLKADTYWESQSPEIKKLSQTLKNKDKTVAENAQIIYEYITSHLNYDFDVIQKKFVERKGALKAFVEKDSWACMEFTDLFIAIARNMGIPARELNGYAFSTGDNIVPLSIDLRGGDLLHSWPEFYDPVYGWVAIDPTWGSTSGVDYFTKLDTSHFIFVTKGLDSEYPLPAGAYRFEEDDKQIEIDFAQNYTENEFEVKLTNKKTSNWNLLKLLQGYDAIEIKNLSGTTVNNIGDSGKNLLPWQKIVIYVKKTSDKFTYQDFSGNNIDYKLQ